MVLTLTLVLGALLVVLGYVLAVWIGEQWARRDLPIRGEPPTALEEAWRSVRAWTRRTWRRWRR